MFEMVIERILFNPVEFTGEKFIFNTKENKVVYVGGLEQRSVR